MVYKVRWDGKNSILLGDAILSEDEVVPPRPVFYEELDLLGFNENWSYPKCKSPLLWAIGRRYYYGGKVVAETKGGGLFEQPKIIFYKKKLNLDPIDLEDLIEKNHWALFKLENEAMDFIEHVFKTYESEIDHFVVSYSGGKDSQVILDLVSRALKPESYSVVFSDTQMELPPTYEAVKVSKQKYIKKYPNLNFIKLSVQHDSKELWEKFGPPSKIQRWCSPVYKTVPLLRYLKKIHDKNNIKVVVFNGVRADESGARSKHSRLSDGSKHQSQINAEIINKWNISEVFLYIFSRGLYLNKLYRQGMVRVGCGLCPYASQWSEYIAKTLYPDSIDGYLQILEKHCNNLGMAGNSAKNYIEEGQWKKRGGGNGVDPDGIHIDFIDTGKNFRIIIKQPRSNFLEWLKTLGQITYKTDKTTVIGELKIKNNTIYFSIESENNLLDICFKNTYEDISLKNKLKRIAYKSTYCLKCGACEVECPTSALVIEPELKINRKICTHCGNCVSLISKGCLVAKSLTKNMGVGKMSKKNTGFGKYQTFGMRENWLKEYFSNKNEWLIKNSLGPNQIMSMKAWLKECELMDGGQTTKLFEGLSDLFWTNENLVWTVLWTNFYYNCPPVHWYLENTHWNGNYTKKELEDIAIDCMPGNSNSTLRGGVSSLVNMFANSPIGSSLGLALVAKKGNKVVKISKEPLKNIDPITVAYSLYKFAEKNNRATDFTVSEFYDEGCNGGPYKEFGIDKNEFENILRLLQEQSILSVDLIADLDNIRLREDLSPIDIITMFGGKL
ncbi:phosphoadenosine phosphosulfate reductase domain-containing protein [Methanococcus maripaludis]|uniref:Phosphoadenosine phosphosulfate reductase n=1 Tax=Methanococcus maripaludis TaxID=39152 RepID=A0A7J9S0B4_METMI|nr:phosphoadenosine phosphosulfate reductase family protein [Methanococcus maripaludis]MBB6067916.1 phosphoadenosine phosphosulfate reductase [Methanococcus maripaludis]